MVKELKQAKKLSAAAGSPRRAASINSSPRATKLGETTVVIAETPAAPQVLRQLIDQLRRKAAPIAVMLGAKQEEGKVMLAAGFSRDLVERGPGCGRLGPRGRRVGRRQRRRPARHGPSRRQERRQAGRRPSTRPGGHREKYSAPCGAPDGYLPPSEA